MARTIEEAVELCHRGYTAWARKAGRNARWPYVPVYRYPDPLTPGRLHETQIPGRAFETREQALAYCGAYIDHLKQHMRERLSDPRGRALRAQWEVEL